MASLQTPGLVKRHPLQRLESPSRDISALIHALGLCSFAYSFNYLIFHPNPVNEAYGWHLQFLTCCGLSVATLTYVIGFLADLTLSRSLFFAKNILALTSAPLECCISILYFTIKAIDPKLLQHPELPDLEPLADFSFHAMPAILLTIDLLYLSPPWTLSALPALGVSSSIATAYWFWVEQCYQHNGYYPYPLFGKLETPKRILLFFGAAAIMTSSTLALKALYGVVNGVGEDRLKERSGGIKKE
ncbi:hypothetical protein K490DRAFT_34749 [Saccharata proteae CBS 121410]|uniref:Integral membrane protein n=1 Tax=Saccharata proteae CBS 121410 TaxID=1314787 RepID=A0A9P4I1V6_9PEZI|nr:hypothetical protein K490DRAFT_34749 [Saccharata proteae CBS 121410]